MALNPAGLSMLSAAEPIAVLARFPLPSIRIAQGATVRKIKDRNGRIYLFRITAEVVQDIKSKLGVDLMNFGKANKLLCRTGSPTDVLLLTSVIYALVEEQALEHGLTEFLWFGTMGGKCFDQAFETFFSEWARYAKRLHMPLVIRAINDTSKLLQRVSAK